MTQFRSLIPRRLFPLVFYQFYCVGLYVASRLFSKIARLRHLLLINHLVTIHVRVELYATVHTGQTLEYFYRERKTLDTDYLCVCTRWARWATVRNVRKLTDETLLKVFDVDARLKCRNFVIKVTKSRLPRHDYANGVKGTSLGFVWMLPRISRSSPRMDKRLSRQECWWCTKGICRYFKNDKTPAAIASKYFNGLWYCFGILSINFNALAPLFSAFVYEFYNASTSDFCCRAPLLCTAKAHSFHPAVLLYTFGCIYSTLCRNTMQFYHLPWHIYGTLIYLSLNNCRPAVCLNVRSAKSNNEKKQ